MVDANVNPSALLGVLAWIDALERIDTLLLETRHFQCNIIFSLRLPILYQALAFEESYLWGEFSNEECRTEAPPVRGQDDGSSGSSTGRNSWFEIFDKIGDSAADIRALANAWIIRFPTVSGISDCSEFAKEFTNTGERKTIQEHMALLVDDINRIGAWGLDARRHYHNLCALQIMKSNILRDKLILCRSGYSTFQWLMTKAREPGDFIDRLGEFMILRSAVVMRLNNYVERFGDLQAQFQNFLDLSLQEDPPPMVRRRQEQGVYTSFLSIRCREVQEAIGDLLSFLRPKDEPPRGTPLVMHRWRHDFTSSTQRLYDDVAEPQQTPSDIQFINSSYWMPDRPDLVSGLAHELAHQDIYTRYHNFASPLLDTERDPLARLVKLLNHCFESFGLFPDDASRNPANRPDFTLPEIVSDLIAAGVEGHAYLYALFLELTTCELGDILEVPIERWDLDLRVSIDGSINPESIGRAWYFRLKILCTWLEAIHHREPGPIVVLLITGVRNILDAVQLYLAKNTPHQQPNAFLFWEHLTNRLCTLVQRSTAASTIRVWRQERSQIVAADTARLRSTPRFYDPLDIDVRNFLLRMFLNMKCAKGRLLHHLRDALLDDLIRPFEKAYFGGAKLDQQSHSRDAFISHEDSLRFRHIYDIPWESAVLSAIDFVHADSTAASEGWLYLFHYQTGMGRELYKVALEFYIQHSRKTSDRLATAIQVVMQFLKSPPLAADVGSLERWLWGERSILDDDLYRLWKEIIVAVKEPVYQQHASGLNITTEGVLNNGRAFADQMPGMVLKEAHALGFSLHRASYHSLEQWVNRITAGLNACASEQAQAAAAMHLRKVLGLQRKQKKMAEHIIEKLQGYKVDILLSILCEPAMRASLAADERFKQLKELKLYLQLWRSSDGHGEDAIHHRSTTRLLLRSLDQNGAVHPANFRPFSHWHAGPCPSRCLQIGRVTLAGDISSAGKETHGALGSPVGVLKQSKWRCTRRDGESVVSQRVLGRFDIVTLQPVRRMSRTSLPWFETNKCASQENFYPFLARHETVIPCRFNLFKAWPDFFSGSKHVFAFLSVVLVERPARLSFVARLLHGKNTQTERPASPRLMQEQEHVSDIVLLFGPDDCILLGEGWGDVIIVFLGDPDEERLDSIFRIQNAIYQDFLVERTELILTSISMNEARKKWNEYEVTSFFRIRGDSEQRANEKFLLGIKSVGQNLGIQDELYVRRIPGLTDFAVDWTRVAAEKFGSSKFSAENIALELEKAGVAAEIDDIVTIISRKERV